jgi:50S ribosomal subunit-associated GTPase HflX
VFVSALTGEGLAGLRTAIAAALAEHIASAPHSSGFENDTRFESADNDDDEVVKNPPSSPSSSA